MLQWGGGGGGGHYFKLSLCLSACHYACHSVCRSVFLSACHSVFLSFCLSLLCFWLWTLHSTVSLRRVQRENISTNNHTGLALQRGKRHYFVSACPHTPPPPPLSLSLVVFLSFSVLTPHTSLSRSSLWVTCFSRDTSYIVAHTPLGDWPALFQDVFTKGDSEKDITTEDNNRLIWIKSTCEELAHTPASLSSRVTRTLAHIKSRLWLSPAKPGDRSIGCAGAYVKRHFLQCHGD